LQPLGLLAGQIEQLVATTGPQKGKAGFTFSDLTQRLLPSIVLDAYPHRKIDGTGALAVARTIEPTPPFRDSAV
jgi:hypothetical protein